MRNRKRARSRLFAALWARVTPVKILGLCAGSLGCLPILLVCWHLLMVPAFAATVISGNVSGTWTTNKSPYILSADCTVVSNQTLTIQPGVTVIIGPGVGVRVWGGIVAAATPEQPIIIRGGSATSYWDRFYLYYSDFTNVFHYCRISDADTALAFLVEGENRVMRVEVFNCDFFNCLSSGIVGQAVGLPDVAVSPYGPETGSATCVPEIHNNVFNQTGNGCYFDAEYVTYYFTNGAGNSFVNPVLSGNIFKNLSGAAVEFTAHYGNLPGTNLSRPLFVNNTVMNANRGVSAEGQFYDAVVRNNLFVRNSNAVYRTGGSTDPNTLYNCFFNNAANFVGYPGIYGIPVLNNHDGDPCDSFFNIFLDPQLLDTTRFLLSNLSPCIDAGDPAIADVCFQFSHGSAISDIGAYGGPDACGWLTHGFAPVITGALADRSSCVGGNAAFNVRVDGSEPLSYRWYFNGTTPLTGETNAQLNLVNLQSNQAGLYSVTVSNAFGCITSAPAALVISDACVGIHAFAGLSITGIVGRTYAVEAATSLNTANWLPIATNTLTQPQWLFIDTNTPINPARFLRVRLRP